ncbi:MAG: caspase family protein, partial [Candidatus Puniceispirillales bacterium]
MRILFLLLFSFLPSLSFASDRVALVVGMAKYETVVTLDNTVNDAISISKTLEAIGFDVRTLTDATSENFRKAIDDFAFQSETADLALIYFAGHGVEVQGENFLIPVDANVKSNKDVQRQSVSLKQLLAAAGNARKMRIVILDSCRDNPFGDALDLAALIETENSASKTRSLTGGLAKPNPDRGTLVAFAAKDGQKALDGTGINSPFAIALMENLPKPNLEISLLFRQVRDNVLETTRNQQEPHTYGSLSGTPYYLAGSSIANSDVENSDLRVAWSDIMPDQESQLVKLAGQGDTRSMIGLAYIRLNSEDSRYAPSKAAQYLILASDEGSAEAQFELAKLYETGLGVEQNIDRALELYELSASADFPDALNDLGFLYFQG